MFRAASPLFVLVIGVVKLRREENKTFRYVKEKAPSRGESGKEGNGFSGRLNFELYDFADSVIYAVIAITIIFVFFVRVFSVDGISMVPTLHNNDMIVVAYAGSKLEKGDVVVVAKTPGFSESLVKRVIALGGDSVYINFSTGKVYVNDAELIEYYVNTPTERQYDIAFPVTVPEGSVFLLGDNRNDSIDSRSSLIGCVEEDNIIGRVLFKLNFGDWKVK